VHVNVVKVHDQPAPAIAVAESPVGSESTTDTVPTVGPPPPLLAMTV
jgi:hypothetical protein